MKRFIKEYANFSINSYKNSRLMDSQIKAQKINAIKRVTEIYSHGIITVDEAIKLINEA